MRLHNQFRASLHYKYSLWLKGYAMFSLGNYPYATVSSDNKDRILTELFEITDPEIEAEINRIEIEAGYVRTEFQLNGIPIFIFIYEDLTANNMKVDSGDWVSFFCQ